MIKIYQHRPKVFRSKIQISTGLIQWNEKFLFLKKKDELWTTPGGKAKKDERLLHTLARELREELGRDSLFESGTFIFKKEFYLGPSLYVLREDIMYRLHIYFFFTLESIKIQLNPEEHTDYAWKTPKEIEVMDCVPGMIEAFKYIGIL
jgi:8-oxo-dGTP pyrophosphatase MutT (NUDIX family)